jgi:hypothetical protein
MFEQNGRNWYYLRRGLRFAAKSSGERSNQKWTKEIQEIICGRIR